MKTVEYRVRPVSRYVVTRYTSEISEGEASGGCETLGEFPNEQSAVDAMRAFQNAEPLHPKTWVVVQRGFDVATMALYATSAQEAELLKAKAETKYGGEFRIFAA